MTYFVLASAMWGAGFVSYSEAGPAQQFVSDPADEATNNQIVTQLESMSGPIGNVVGTLGGGLLAIWGVVASFINLVFWPYTTLVQNNAPPEVSLLLGGGLSAAFVAGIVTTVRGSA